MSFTLKIQLRDDLRRIAFDNYPSFIELRSTIASLFLSRNLHPNFAIKYIDEEGDHVTVESDFELNFAFRRGATTRLIITEPSASTPTPSPAPSQPAPQQKTEAVPPPVRPVPLDFTPFLQNVLRSFGGAPQPGFSTNNQPQGIDLAPLMSMAMRLFAPQQTCGASQAGSPCDLSGIFNLLSAFNPTCHFNPTTASGSSSSSSTPEKKAPETSTQQPKKEGFSCPFDFFQGLVESALEANEEWQKIAEKWVRRFIKEHVKTPDNTLPQLEELITLAVNTIITFINDPEVQEQCPWIKLFATEQVRGMLDSILASPVVQEVVFTAYTAVSEAVEKKKARTQPQTQQPPVVIPVPVPRVPEPAVVVPPPAPTPAPTPAPVREPEHTEEEKELRQLGSMGFVDRQLNLRLLRQTNFDLWETVQLLLQN